MAEEEYEEDTLKDIRRAIQAEGLSEATQYSREEPEAGIEFDASIINPSDHVRRQHAEITRETVLGNLEWRDRYPTWWMVNDQFEMAHFLRMVGLKGENFERRAILMLNLSRSRGMAQQKELRTRRVEVVGAEEKKKRWSWR